MQSYGIIRKFSAIAISKLVSAYPLRRGAWRLRMWASPYLVTKIEPGVWIRVSGMVDSEWSWFDGTAKEPATEELLRTVLRPGMTVVDVGANVGYFTLLAASRVTQQGAVVSFEPTPAIAARLRENVALNQFNWVETVEAAVTDAAGPVRLYTSGDGDAEGNSLFVVSENSTPCEVQGVTLDDYFLSAENGRKIDFIKIDAEGAEPRILRGATKIIGRDKPALLLEVNPLALEAAGSSPDEVLGMIRDFGYHVREVESAPWQGVTVVNVIAIANSV